MSKKKKLLTAFLVLFLLFLGWVFVATWNSSHPLGRDARRVSDLHQIRDRLEDYYKINGKYPVKLNDILGVSSVTSIPKDPLTGKPYDYAPSSDQKSYVLRAMLADIRNSIKGATGTINGLDCTPPAYCIEF